ncbi:MAG: hypothetical protein ACRD0U_13970 [Acidimicrobiales bacterium]
MLLLGLIIGLLLGVAIGMALQRRRSQAEGGFVTRHDLALPPRPAGEDPEL